jgi:hypothetical protein
MHRVKVNLQPTLRAAVPVTGIVLIYISWITIPSLRKHRTRIRRLGKDEFELPHAPAAGDVGEIFVEDEVIITRPTL